MFPINLSITHIEKHAPDLWSFFMVPQSAARLDFIAGQVAILEMAGYGSSYVAFASAPEDEEYEFLIKRSELANVTRALFDPHIAKRASLREIVGPGFPVERYKGRDLVFVAMGTGVAPLRSALRHIFHARDEYGRLIVLYGVRSMGDFAFAQESATDWISHGVELRQVISQPGDGDWSGPTGYVQSLLDNVIPTLKQPVALVCGSPEMIGQTTERLRAMGFAPDEILTNY